MSFADTEDDRRVLSNGHKPRIERLALEEMPPHNTDAEFGLLAAEIYKPGSFAQAGVVRSDFYTGSGREVFDAIESMRLAAAPISFETLRFFLKKCLSEGGLSRLEALGGEGIIAAIESCTSGPIYLDYYLKQARNCAVLRQIKEAALAIAGQANDPEADSGVLVEEARTKFTGLTPTSSGTEFKFLDAAQLDAGDFSRRYLIEDVLVEGEPGGIYGSFKTLKTSISIAMGFSLASGVPFLDKFRVPDPVPFAMMSGESGLAALQDTARRVCASKGWSLDKLRDRLFITSELPSLYSPAHLNALERFIRSRGIKVLVVDPAYLAMGDVSEPGNLFAMGKCLRPIADACRQWGCAFQMAHHCKRNNQGFEKFAPAELSDIAWSGFAEFSAQWLLLARRSKFDPESGNHELWLTVGGRAGHSGVYGLDVYEGRRTDSGGRAWQASVRLASETRASADDSRETAKEAAADRRRKATFNRRVVSVAQALLSLDGAPETSSKIANLAGCNNTTGGPALVWLKDQGIIARATVTKNNVPHEGWRVVDPGRCAEVARGGTNVGGNGAADNDPWAPECDF